MQKILPRDELLGQQFSAAISGDAAELAKKSARVYMKNMTQYKCAMMDIEGRFKLLNEEYVLEHGRAPISSIKTRVKSIPSIKEKLERKEYPVSFDSAIDNLDDIAGVRVICSFPDDVNTMAEALLRQDDISLVKKRDYITNPKANGYRSLHLVVTTPIYLSNEKKQIKVEIQLRTIAMDFWASLEHELRYKSDADFTEEMADELLECAQLSADLDNRMAELRKKCFRRTYCERGYKK